MVTLTEKNRLRKQRWRKANPGLEASDDRPFVGVDGEGGTIPGSDRHTYFLLRAGEKAIADTEKGLSSLDCLTFLSELDPHPIYVAFFFDYDVTMMCRDLGWEKVYRLVHRELRIPTRSKRAHVFPVDVYEGAFQIDWLPRKFFKVRKRISLDFTTGKPVYGPWITVNDTGTFFQCRFTEALERWQIGSEEARAAILAGKEHRNTFDAGSLTDIDRYNHLECRLLSELMTEFRSVCKRSGYVPRHWQGPGQIAEAMFRARGIPKKKKIPLFSDPSNARLLEFAANAFYGGRPEITKIGPVNVPVYQYDINSAYPYAMLSLPCLEHGQWRYHEHGAPGHALGLHYGHFKPKPTAKGKPGKAYLWGFPVRREDGSIFYPREGNGWYWSMEIAAAKHQDFYTQESFTYVIRCACQPFSFLRDLYAMRIRLGKDLLGLFLKLAMNSCYGKLAQSIGSPQYANPIWASYITAFTRAQIQEMIHSGPEHKAGRCGKDVLMVATDAIFTDRPFPLPDDRELGGITCEIHPDGILLIQPGLYFRGDGKRPKTRGVPWSAMADLEEEFMTAWRLMNDKADEKLGVVDVPLSVFIGLRQAIHRRKLETAGTWTEFREDGTHDGKRISFDYHTKREFIVPSPFGAAAQTYPYIGGPDLVTVPYSREIGQWRAEMRLPFEDQPDWATMLEMEGDTL